MHELTLADKIWNRACEGGGDFPRAGDRALAALLLFHGPAMNGGVLHAAECLSSAQLTEAQAGYRYFGHESVADLVVAAAKAIQLGQGLDTLEAAFDQKYWAEIPDDGVLVNRFENHQRANPQEYSLLAPMNRTAALEALVNISQPISEAVSRLAEFPWDCESELVLLAPQHFSYVLSLFKQGALSASEVENWANALECRDDVCLSTLQAQELLHELANPLLTQPLSGERADYWLARLPYGR